MTVEGSYMARFTYARAGNMEEALALLNEPGLRSRVLAGGTDLLLLLREDARACDRVVDISLIPELHEITRIGDTVTIGAAVTFSEAMESPVVGDTAPLLAESCRQVGAVQIRNMGTLGGNVANAAACADSLPALVCLDAVARVRTVQRDSALSAPAALESAEREWPVAELVTGPNRTQIPAGSLLVSLSYATPPPGSRGVFLKLGRRNAMAISRLTVAALGRLDVQGRIVETRLVLGSATPQIRRLVAVEQLLLGHIPHEALFEEAAHAAVGEVRKISGRRWSSEFKEPALTAMVSRALRHIFSAATAPDLTSLAPERPSESAPARQPSNHPMQSFVAGPDITIQFALNGKSVQVEAPADITLLGLLRDHLDLTGTKEGCGVGECGACSVLLDGRLVNSCLVLAAQAHGRHVTTIEGVCHPDGRPSDLQQAFIDHGAVQCGFCIPGMVLAGESLLAAHAQPTRAEIRQAIAGNLCRCTGYQQIIDAIEATASRRELDGRAAPENGKQR
jgi:xanthine dehydrogenase iron-sulfur cluster and FAD-binding subunit A